MPHFLRGVSVFFAGFVGTGVVRIAKLPSFDFEGIHWSPQRCREA